MRKLAILHFNPIERYPPVLNWLNFLAAQGDADLQVRVFTMAPANSGRYDPGTEKIRIIRAGSSTGKAFRSRWNYLVHYIVTIKRLLAWRPDAVLYYETLSALPAYLYKKFFRRRALLAIHYHEYVSPEEYRQGMKLGRWIHRLEKKIYKDAVWISQTNPDRLRLFREDQGLNGSPACRVLPNYPPHAWQSAQRSGEMASPIRMVYVGALSLDTMYTSQLAEWIITKGGSVTWDIYSDNFTTQAKQYIESLGSKWIRFGKGVDYYSLPGILAQYDIGIILYKGHIPNYVYNAPNKLFEYRNCGLDVWFPDVMTGCLPYATSGTWPKVTAIDFQRLTGLDSAAATDRSGLVYLPGKEYAEQVLPDLLNALTTCSE